MLPKLKVLFLCTGNSCRSQMAEGWARALKGDVIEPYSAGIETHGLNPRAVKVMAEAGVDISGHHSKLVSDLAGVEFDYVVTVCGHAHEHCPVFPGKTRVIHVGFDDPPLLVREARTEEEALVHYRRVRDEIRQYVESLPSALSGAGGEKMPIENDQSLDRQEGIHSAVREGYGQIAKSDEACGCGLASCCGAGSARKVAEAVGYNEAELAALPEGANMGLSCGNPTAIASLRPGEVVVDLGSGGGFDAFIAGRKVGPDGRVIGVDMTPEMLARARGNVAAYRQHAGLDNVEFRLGEIEHLPVADASVDVILSNCVLNLSPDKPQVWREIGRVLKPGGRVAVSDLALLRPLPEVVRGMIAALVGCVAGAVLVEDTRAMMDAAGLTEIALTPKPEYVEAMTDWNDPLYKQILDYLPSGTRAGDFITSLDISARKPTAACCCR